MSTYMHRTLTAVKHFTPIICYFNNRETLLLTFLSVVKPGQPLAVTKPSLDMYVLHSYIM